MNENGAKRPPTLRPSQTTCQVWWGYSGCRAGCMKKCDVFCPSGSWNYDVCATETLWSCSVIFKTTRNTFYRTRSLSNATFSFLITWHSTSSKSAAVCKISWKSDDFSPRYGDISIFKMAAARPSGRGSGRKSKTHHSLTAGAQPAPLPLARRIYGPFVSGLTCCRKSTWLYVVASTSTQQTRDNAPALTDVSTWGHVVSDSDAWECPSLEVRRKQTFDHSMLGYKQY